MGVQQEGDDWGPAKRLIRFTLGTLSFWTEKVVQFAAADLLRPKVPPLSWINGLFVQFCITAPKWSRSLEFRAHFWKLEWGGMQVILMTGVGQREWKKETKVNKWKWRIRVLCKENEREPATSFKVWHIFGLFFFYIFLLPCSTASLTI